MPTVSVLIPTLNASEWLPKQLEALNRQSTPITEIVLIDSESEDSTLAIAAADPLCRIMHVKRTDFDHGGTRDKAARTCTSDFIWFLTQDAIPADQHCLGELIKAVADKDVAAAYARQIAAKGASHIEQLNRLTNYPTESFTRSADDIEKLQIRAFFMSNTCCLYKREIYIECGGFRHGLPTNEDLLMAATFLQKGYRTAYCATAWVWHTHNMTLKQWYRRSFDIAAFMDMHKDSLCGVKAMGEGRKYALSIIKRLLKEGHPLSTIHFAIICAARLLGDYDGHRHKSLSQRSILRRTQNPAFWIRYLQNNSAACTIDYDSD